MDNDRTKDIESLSMEQLMTHQKVYKQIKKIAEEISELSDELYYNSTNGEYVSEFTFYYEICNINEITDKYVEFLIKDYEGRFDGTHKVPIELFTSNNRKETLRKWMKKPKGWLYE